MGKKKESKKTQLTQAFRQPKNGGAAFGALLRDALGAIKSIRDQSDYKNKVEQIVAAAAAQAALYIFPGETGYDPNKQLPPDNQLRLVTDAFRHRQLPQLIDAIIQGGCQCDARVAARADDGVDDDDSDDVDISNEPELETHESDLP